MVFFFCIKRKVVAIISVKSHRLNNSVDSDNKQTNAIVGVFFVKTRHDKFSAKTVTQFLAGNSKFPNTMTPMAMGEAVGVAPARRQNLVLLRTYRPIF